MEPDCPSLTISRFLAEEKIFLVGALDALRLCGNGEYEAMHPTQALWEFSWPGFRFDWQIRSFVAKTCLTLTPLSFLSDADVLDIIKRSVQNRNLVALKKVAQVAGPADPTVEMRRLVRDLETKTRGKLNESGRAYKLVADVDLKRVPERDSYQVVAQDEGRKVLDALAKAAWHGP
jgi:hypothetical protein